MSAWPARQAGATLAFLLAAAPAGAGEAAAPPAGAKTITLAAREFDEECMDLAAGQVLAYSFRADAPLEFNIHHHRGTKVLYPVRKAGVAQLTATYSPKQTDGYCMMWRNPHPRVVTVEYRFEVAASRK